MSIIDRINGQDVWIGSREGWEGILDGDQLDAKRMACGYRLTRNQQDERSSHCPAGWTGLGHLRNEFSHMGLLFGRKHLV